MPDSVTLRLETAAPLFTGPNWDYTGLRRVSDPSQIFSVFHELFAKGGIRA